jgi:DNA polymerase III subunit delta
MPPRFYLLHGPDEFGSAEFLDGLKEKMGDPSLAALNTTILDGRSVTLAEVQSMCGALPFLARRRLVLVEGWLTRLLNRTERADEDDEAAPPSGPGSSAREILAALLEYLPQVPETTALVFIEKREIPERHALRKATAGADWAYVKFFDLRRGEALVRWIRQRAKDEGGEFTREAAQALAEVDDDPRSLGNEINKLLTYVNRERPVELEDVQVLTPAGGEARVFDLVDAIGQRRGTQALRELHHLLQSQEPVYILGMIVRQYRLMLQARELLNANATEAEISKALALHAYPTGKVCAQARNFTQEALDRLYGRLLDYDADIKTGRAEASTALNSLVVALTAA